MPAKKTTKKTASKKKATKKTASKKKATAKKATTSKKKATKKKKKATTKGFKAGHRVGWDGHKTRCLYITDKNLISALMRVMHVSEDYRSRKIQWYIEEAELCTKYRRLEKLAAEDADVAKTLKGLNAYLQKLVDERLELFQKNFDNGFAVFDDLWLMYYEGQHVVFDDEGSMVAGEITKAGVQRGWGGLRFAMTLKIIVHDGTKFVFRDKECSVPFYLGGERIKNLPVRPVDDDLRKTLSERGAKVMGVIKAGSSYVHYDGEIISREWYGTKRYRANGRCMLDPKTHRKVNEEYERRMASDFYDDAADTVDAQNTLEEILEEDFWRMSPWIPGFSFTAKQWGECNIEDVSEIQFNTNAYDQLVLPERTIDGLEIAPKQMIRSLVEHGAVGFTDVIADKGGGIIFLLHGPPGTGKTLTAEAIADLLKRPLYSVSVGELGTKTMDLERNLRMVLEVATLWNAVLLIDEADIFLEKRTPRDIERNALVAIFLRMLEYYQGVLFLTTNRVKQFDPAFNSRLSIALDYPDHTPENRARIWTNLMVAAGLKPKKFDIKALAAEDVNGRQIKHAIRIGLSLAANEGRKVQMEDFMKTIRLHQLFNQQLGGDAEILSDEFKPITEKKPKPQVLRGGKKKKQPKNGRARA
jgi:hypothetical protein